MAFPALSLRAISRMSDEEAFDLLVSIRWATSGGNPLCPRCGCEKHYRLRSRPVFRCVSCAHDYSATSGSIFASRKLPIKDYLIAIALFSGAAKGVSALQIGRYLDTQYKTAFVLCHKIREAMQRLSLTLAGVVEVDGCTIGGYKLVENYVRPGSLKRRYYQKNFDNRRVVVVARERFGQTRAFVGHKETECLTSLQECITAGSIICADAAHAWDNLSKLFEMLRVQHNITYVANDSSTNWAESFFSLLRKMQYGVHHQIGAENLSAYANELAWRQDYRRLSEQARLHLLLSLVLAAPVSIKWVGYWQRSKTAEVAPPLLLTAPEKPILISEAA